MSIYERIKEQSRQQGLSLQDVARRAGIGINSIYRWRNSNPSLPRLEKVAHVLGVSTDYLLKGEASKPTNKTPIKADIDDQNVIFTYQGKPLSEDDKALIRRLMNGKEE